jgi:hypothetical protein
MNVFAVEHTLADVEAEVSEHTCGMNPVIGKFVSALPLFCDTLVPPVPVPHVGQATLYGLAVVPAPVIAIGDEAVTVPLMFVA